MELSITIFFFSSRRRHTRSKRDWSSDVCSSDLGRDAGDRFSLLDGQFERFIIDIAGTGGATFLVDRSEERRVGKECRSLGGAGLYKKREEKKCKQQIAMAWCAVDRRCSIDESSM